jgi:hypothetical protein
MMQFYFVKKPLYGIQAGRVERFALHKAATFLLDGSIEPYDEKRHGKAPGAPAPEIREAAAGRQK